MLGTLHRNVPSLSRVKLCAATCSTFELWGDAHMNGSLWTVISIDFPPKRPDTSPSRTFNMSSSRVITPMAMQRQNTGPNSTVPPLPENHMNSLNHPSPTRQFEIIDQLPRQLDSFEKARLRLGLNPEHPIDDEHKIATVHDHKLWWPRLRLVLREPFAEFCGVFIMVLFGDGSVAQVLLSTGQTTAPGGNGWGGYQSISWG